MKKSLSIKLLFPVAAIALLAGCGRGGQTDEPVSDIGYVRSRTTIHLATTINKDTGMPKLQQLAKKFMDEVEPNVKVVVDKIEGDYNDAAEETSKKIGQNLHGDMVMVYPDAVAGFMRHPGVVYNLDTEEFMKHPEYGWTDEERNDIIPGYLKEGQNYPVPGTYSLPMSKSTELMFYNKAKFIGINFGPTVNGGKEVDETYMNNLTWEELFNNLAPACFEYAKTHTGYLDTTGNHGILGYDSDDNLFITLSEQYGFDYTGINPKNGKGQILFNNEAARNVLKTFSDAAQKHYIITKGTNDNQYTSKLTAANKCLMSIGSTGGTIHQHISGQDILVAPIPQHEGGTKATIMQGPSMAFLAHKTPDGKIDKVRQQASWLFYKFLSNTENCVDWALTTGYSPIRVSGLHHPDYEFSIDISETEPLSSDRLLARAAHGISSIESYYFSTPTFIGSGDARQCVKRLAKKCLTIDSAATQEQRYKNIDGYFAEEEKAAIAGL